MSDFDDVFVSVETKEPAQSKEERRTTPKEWWQIREQKRTGTGVFRRWIGFSLFFRGKRKSMRIPRYLGRIDRYSFRNVLLIHKKVSPMRHGPEIMVIGNQRVLTY